MNHPNKNSPIFMHEEKTIIFIDGPNFYSSAKNLGFDIDYAKLRRFFEEETYLIRINYYSAILDTEEYSPLKPLTAWMSYNGYNVVTKSAKEFTDGSGKRRIKGNMDVEICIDMLESAKNIEHIILFSGDSDFRRLVEMVQRQGVRVTVISTVKVGPMISDDLRRQADQFIDIESIRQYIERDPHERQERQERSERSYRSRQKNNSNSDEVEELYDESVE